jgi:hypothetical protein
MFPVTWRRRSGGNLHLEFDDVQTFEQVQADIELQRRYGKFYEHRTMIGHNECMALVNQPEIEISKSMSAESTVIARSSHRDGQLYRSLNISAWYSCHSLCARHVLHLIKA